MRRVIVLTLAGLLFAVAAAAQDATVSVQGNVKSPGTYTFNADGSMTLRDAIRRAGGLLAGSDPGAIIYRADEHGVIRQLKAPIPRPLDREIRDFHLKPGDVVYVPGLVIRPPHEPVIDDRIIPAGVK